MSENIHMIWNNIQVHTKSCVTLEGRRKTMNFLVDIFNFQKMAEALNQISAVSKSQAVIEFKLDGTIITANKNFLVTMGYTLDEIKGKHHSLFAEAAYKESSEYVNFWKALASGEFQAGEFMRLAKGGRVVWLQASYNPVFNASGKPYKVVKFASDITKEKVKIVEEQTRNKQIIENMPVNMILADVNGTITTANPQTLKTLKTLEQFLPIRVEQLIGQSIDIFHKMPAHQRKIISDPRNLPHTATIDVGPEKLDLLVTPLSNAEGKYVGPMLTWSVVTDKFNLAKRTQDSKGNLQSTVMSLVGESGSASDELSNCITGVVAAIEEMNASIQEIATNTTRAAEMTRDTVTRSQMVETLITSLEACSKEIGEIVQVVNSISSQTNLLALNATIEAARAGDAGKGFAVVANEVKALASQTSDATKDIQQKIDAIQSQTKEALVSVGETSNSVRSINEVVTSIASAIEEQTAVSSEITKNMSQANLQINTVSKSIDHISQSVEQNIALMG